MMTRDERLLQLMSDAFEQHTGWKVERELIETGMKDALAVAQREIGFQGSALRPGEMTPFDFPFGDHNA